MKQTNCRQCGLAILIGEDGLCAECVSLRDRPDATATRTHLNGIPFQDMKQIDEVDRFKLIADKVKSNPGKTIAVLVEYGGANRGKGDRYIAGVRAHLPEVEVSRSIQLVKGIETLVFKI